MRAEGASASCTGESHWSGRACPDNKKSPQTAMFDHEMNLAMKRVSKSLPVLPKLIGGPDEVYLRSMGGVDTHTLTVSHYHTRTLTLSHTYSVCAQG